MIRAKLFILRQEIDLLWTDMNYVRTTKKDGKPTSEVLGGYITMAFEASEGSEILNRWMLKESADDTHQSVDLLEEGEIRFYNENEEESPLRVYKFADAYPYFYQEVFDADNGEAMSIIMSISPAIQEYSSKLIKSWNVNYIPPSESAPSESTQEEKQEPKFLGYHFENDQGERIEQGKIQVDDVVFLLIETENADGENMTLNLEDDRLDFKYNGKVLENDTLKGIAITGSLTKVKLTAVAQGSE